MTPIINVSAELNIIIKLGRPVITAKVYLNIASLTTHVIISTVVADWHVTESL